MVPQEQLWQPPLLLLVMQQMESQQLGLFSPALYGHLALDLPALLHQLALLVLLLKLHSVSPAPIGSAPKGNVPGAGVRSAGMRQAMQQLTW